MNSNMILFSDVIYYDSLLSVAYNLKNRLLKILLVFSSKIEDLTLSFVAYLKTEGKWGNRSLSSRNLRFAKIKHIGDNFTDSAAKWKADLRILQRILGCTFCGLEGRVLLCIWARTSDSFAAKRESRQIWLWRSHLFLSLLALL